MFVIPAAGGAAIRLTDAPEPDARPTWSVDGKWVYFTSEREGGGAWKVPAAGGTAVRVSNVRANVYRASPDGKWLFASVGAVVTRIPLAGGQSQEVFRGAVNMPHCWPIPPSVKVTRLSRLMGGGWPIYRMSPAAMKCTCRGTRRRALA